MSKGLQVVEIYSWQATLGLEFWTVTIIGNIYNHLNVYTTSGIESYESDITDNEPQLHHLLFWRYKVFLRTKAEVLLALV